MEGIKCFPQSLSHHSFIVRRVFQRFASSQVFIFVVHPKKSSIAFYLCADLIYSSTSRTNLCRTRVSNNQRVDDRSFHQEILLKNGMIQNIPDELDHQVGISIKAAEQWSERYAPMIAAAYLTMEVSRSGGCSPSRGLSSKELDWL